MKRWADLNTLGKLNYIFFASNMFFMCTAVISNMFIIAVIHFLCAFLCWLSLYAPNCYK